MKKAVFLFCLFFIGASYASDTVYVHNPQIPVLIDRHDNILCEMRIPAAGGQRLDNVVLRFSDDTDLRQIKSVKLYYGGVESPLYDGVRFRPVDNYIPRNHMAAMREARPAYSVLQSEIRRPKRENVLASGQRMLGPVDYFWISIEMKKGASPDAQVVADVSAAVIDGKSFHIKGEESAGVVRRMGVGVRYAGDDDVAAYRIPGLATTKKGTLIAVYDVRYRFHTDLQEKIDIGVSRSTDGGKTWKPMQIAMTFAGAGGLPHGQNGVGDPSILVDENTGTIWIVASWIHGLGNSRAWTGSSQGLLPEQTGQLVLVRSDDDGRTWSKPINITEQVKRPEWYYLLQGPGRGITMHDGTLVFPAQFKDEKQMPYSTIIYSRDNGTTWHIGTGARMDTTEAQVVEIEDGVLMLNMRDNRGGSRAVVVTYDMGQTWREHPSSRSALREPVCMASLLNVEAEDNVLGRDLLLFSNPDTTVGRHHITIKASLDGGHTWSDNNKILLDEEPGWGYSCLTLIDSETIGILYEASVAHMVFQRIKIKDFIREL